MKEIMAIMVVVLALGGLVGGVSAFAHNGSGGSGPQGQVIDLVVGDTYEVALESNGTTGYQWLVEHTLCFCNENLLEIIDQRFEVDSDLIGAAGEQVFVLRAVGAGTVDVMFTYKRPWEDEVLRSVTYTFNITL
ncbi:protease inhibitor I42 family protein [Chloroflexota bacterium]